MVLILRLNSKEASSNKKSNGCEAEVTDSNDKRLSQIVGSIKNNIYWEKARRL